MTKGKPVLKRSFPRNSSHRGVNRGAFILIIFLIGFMSWALIKVVTHPRLKKSESTSQKASGQNRSDARSKMTAAAPQRSARIRALPVPPETIEFEKDSMTFPGTAPRLEHKPPVPPKGPQRIDWSKPAIVFVIDDIGHEKTYDAIIDQLGNKITYAILPHLRFSQFYGEKSRSTGADVILHLPLESERGIYPGPGLITRFMPEDEIRHMVAENLESVPNHIGANNHMGSLGTSDGGFMQIILDEFKKRNLFFLDSFTSPRSLVVPISRQMLIPVLRRDVFLDNVEKTEPIRQQVQRAAQVASSSGYAIAIGHYKKYTLEVLADEIPKLEKQGYQIIKLSDLMRHYN